MHRLPKSDQTPIADQTSNNQAPVKLISAHLALIKQGYDLVCAHRDEAQMRADNLKRKNDEAGQAYLSALERYYENNQEYKLRSEHAKHLN